MTKLTLKKGGLMDNILFKYFENRYKEATGTYKKSNKFGPVITISRQAGCEAKKVATKLATHLNSKLDKPLWHIVDKEILEQSAKELNLTTSKIEHFYKGEEKSSFIDMFIAFSNSHVNDLKIRNTIKDIILSMCSRGHVILIGRAGAAIMQGKSNVLNVRLTAPFFWRIDAIIKNRNTPIEEAEEWAIDTDEQRYKLFYQFLDKQPSNLDYLFDATLNREAFDVEDIVKAIVSLAEIKKLSK